MKATVLIDSIRKRFIDMINQKTGWGRNEVKFVFEESVSQGLSDVIDLDIFLPTPNKED